MLGSRGLMRSRWVSAFVVVVAAALIGGYALSTPQAWSKQGRTVPEDHKLQLQMQRFLAPTNPLAPNPARSTIYGPPMPSAGGGVCFTGSGGCSLTPCVEPVDASALAQLSPSASSAASCSSHRAGLPHVVAVVNPTTGAGVSITGPPAIAVIDPRTGAVVSITPDELAVQGRRPRSARLVGRADLQPGSR